MTRKLLPALYRVITENNVADKITILGVARHQITEDEFRTMAEDALIAAGHTGDEIASNHDGRATFSFADGHSEAKQVIFKGDDKKTMAVKKNWLGPRATVPFGRR